MEIYKYLASKKNKTKQQNTVQTKNKQNQTQTLEFLKHTLGFPNFIISHALCPG